MFSGIVEEIGVIVERLEIPDGLQLTIDCALVRADLAIGSSIAVDGVCQTVVDQQDIGIIVIASDTTLKKTSLGSLSIGDRVNLERALLASGRLNGHFVQGHVNDTATIHSWNPQEETSKSWQLQINIPEHLRRYVVLEGSLTVNGVSLTVSELEKLRVSFSIIPYTASHTALRDRLPGDEVNIEVDIIAKYIESLQIDSRGPYWSTGNHPAVSNGIDGAIEKIASGKMIIVVDDETRENEGDLVIAAQHITPAIVNFMVTHGRGIVCVPVTLERAKQLELSPMSPVNDALHGTAFTVSVDYRHGTSTGTSASDRAATIAALANPTSVARDFARPGHIFPVIAELGGVAIRPGHTEAVIELMKRAGCYPVAVICEIMSIDGRMADYTDLNELSQQHGLPIVSVKEVASLCI